MKIKDKIERIKVQDLKYYPDNPRSHTKEQIKQIANQIKLVGFNQPIIIDENHQVLVGNGRLAAADLLNMDELPCIRYLKLNEAQKKQLIIADNKLNDLSDWDNDILGNWLNELNELGLEHYFEPEEMTEIWDEPEPETKEDNFEEPKEAKYKVELGDVYQLGEHRLMCGDSTKKEDVDKLLDTIEIDLLFTDPPYGISIVNCGNSNISAKIKFGKVGTTGVVPAKTYKKVIGDEEFFDPSFLLLFGKSQIIWGANNFSSKLIDNSHWLVWDKKCEKGADHNNFSDCELAWTNINKKAVRVYRYLWSGLLREGKRTLELKERVHPTQKPVGLLGDIIKDYSMEKNTVLDLFGGSGSTLIACEQLNRKCYMMELDEYYCSVIIERWEKFTGKEHIKLDKK